MTNKSSLRKQVIIPISFTNLEKFIAISNKHIANINSVLKNIKSDIVADFIQKYNRGLVITTNKVVANSDLNTIENYIKNIDMINSNKTMSLRISQNLGHLLLHKNMNLFITTNIIERVLQMTYIFNDIVLTFHSHIIKVSSKSNITIIWIDIWDSQSGSNTKILINKCFNISSHIVTIWDMNINLDIPQYKNCWK